MALHLPYTSILPRRQIGLGISKLTLSTYNLVEAGVPQLSILDPILFTMYTNDIPVNPNRSQFSVADDSTILTSYGEPAMATQTLQFHFSLLYVWFKKWIIKITTEELF